MAIWRLINSGPASPYENMAYDESLFYNYERHQKPTLRIYSWCYPSFSLGFSQKAADSLYLDRFRDKKVSFVRRITAGGILLHDHDITYSVICSQKDLGSCFGVKESFKHICGFLINFYEKLGLKAYFCGDVNKKTSGLSSVFCLDSFQDYDILIGSKKIGGNAQRRKKDLILQHGSIPFRLDFTKIREFIKGDLPALEAKTASLNELICNQGGLDALLGLFTESFQETLSCRLAESEPTDSETQFAHFLEKEKYSSFSWNVCGITPALSLV
ncbi:MAG: lipoate--protein ligase family protein [Candidatus Omnitrophica bacterium]|nr:lipoate--protein ligase family protein [Candidatus Omnitrophota bacterium]